MKNSPIILGSILLILITLTSCTWFSGPGTIDIIGERSAIPVFNPSSGSYTNGIVNVQMSTATPGANIIYTLDGSEPINYNLWFMSLETLNQQVTQNIGCYEIFESLNETIYNETNGNNTYSWRYHLGGLISINVITEEQLLSCQQVIDLFGGTGDPNLLLYDSQAVNDCLAIYQAMRVIIQEDINNWMAAIGNMSNETVNQCFSIFDNWFNTVAGQQGSFLYIGPFTLMQSTQVKANSYKDGYFPSLTASAFYEISNYTPPINIQPTVYAGADISVQLPDTANLNGYVQDDGLPNPPSEVTLTWSKVSGPGTVTFTSTTSITTTATFSTSGTYVIRLTASDSQLSSYDDVQVVVLPVNAPNVPPFIVISEPTDGWKFGFKSNLRIKVKTIYGDSDGSVVNVKYYNDGVLFAQNLNGFATLINPTLGNHTLTSEAIDNEGASTMSQPIRIEIVNQQSGGQGKGKIR